jgi:apolipoprotein D and lipocalin family protein
MKRALKTIFITVAGILGFSACAETPPSPNVIKNFELNRYLGTWYEIARFDHSFERGLSNVTANYSLRPDGKVKVINRGFKTKSNSWSESVGKAKFAGEETIGSLKVSFFGPFYGAYNIVKLDENYQYALVVSSGTDYLWLLSRTPTIPENIKQQYLDRAKELGLDTSKLIWVKQD